MLKMHEKAKSETSFLGHSNQIGMQSLIFLGASKNFDWYTKGHFTKVYSIKGCELTNFPWIRLIGISCIHTVRTQLILIRRISGKFLSQHPIME